VNNALYNIYHSTFYVSCSALFSFVS